MIIVDNLILKDALNLFTLDLSVAGFGGAYTFTNIGQGVFFDARVRATNQMDSQQFVATALVPSSDFLDASDGWDGATTRFNQPGFGTTRYLGFQLTVGEGDSRYGWIEYFNDGTTVTVSRWAYESNLNTGISTPAPSNGGGGAVPGLGGLAALACGAAGMRRSRNRVA